MLAATTQPAFAAEDPKCMARFDAERGRIEREAAATAPKASDLPAYQRWSANLHAALQAAGREAEACNKRSTPPLSTQERSSLDACLARASGRLAEAEKRYQGRALSMAEQTAQRALQQQALDERDACVKAHRR
ncbi:MAG: hypothetical protein V4757_22080 [Pseudomonadota bacterium]